MLLYWSPWVRLARFSPAMSSRLKPVNTGLLTLSPLTGATPPTQ
jgi:hypothetical protein